METGGQITKLDTKLEKLRRALDIYFEFNYVDGCDDYYFEVNDYNDGRIHWNPNTFRSGKKITVIGSPNKFVVLETMKIKRILLDNMDKLYIDGDDYSCEVNLIRKDIAGGAGISPLEEGDLDNFKRFKKEQDDATKRILPSD